MSNITLLGSDGAEKTALYTNLASLKNFQTMNLNPAFNQISTIDHKLKNSVPLLVIDPSVALPDIKKIISVIEFKHPIMIVFAYANTNLSANFQIEKHQQALEKLIALDTSLQNKFLRDNVSNEILFFNMSSAKPVPAKLIQTIEKTSTETKSFFSSLFASKPKKEVEAPVATTQENKTEFTAYNSKTDYWDLTPRSSYQ